MNHTDTDIAEILERFKESFSKGERFIRDIPCYWIEDFIYRECLALKKKWEREHFDNQ